MERGSATTPTTSPASRSARNEAAEYPREKASRRAAAIRTLPSEGTAAGEDDILAARGAASPGSRGSGCGVDHPDRGADRVNGLGRPPGGHPVRSTARAAAPRWLRAARAGRRAVADARSPRSGTHPGAHGATPPVPGYTHFRRPTGGPGRYASRPAAREAGGVVLSPSGEWLARVTRPFSHHGGRAADQSGSIEAAPSLRNSARRSTAPFAGPLRSS